MDSEILLEIIGTKDAIAGGGVEGTHIDATCLPLTGLLPDQSAHISVILVVELVKGPPNAAFRISSSRDVLVGSPSKRSETQTWQETHFCHQICLKANQPLPSSVLLAFRNLGDTSAFAMIEPWGSSFGWLPKGLLGFCFSDSSRSENTPLLSVSEERIGNFHGFSFCPPLEVPFLARSLDFSGESVEDEFEVD